PPPAPTSTRCAAPRAMSSRTCSDRTLPCAPVRPLRPGRSRCWGARWRSRKAPTGSKPTSRWSPASPTGAIPTSATRTRWRSGGDSRAYWLARPDAAEPARLVTADHSWAAQMVAAGVLDEAAAMRDPRAHAITRWLGAGGSTEAEVATLHPAGEGALLLCSDGLWNYLPDA